jgi:hypothetical protein
VQPCQQHSQPLFIYLFIHLFIYFTVNPCAAMPATLTAAAAAHAPGIGSYFWEGSMNKKIFDTEQQPQHTPQE